MAEKLSSAEWEALLEDYHASSLSAKEWCRKHNVEWSQLRYRINKSNLKLNKNEGSTQFIGVQVLDESALSNIMIHIGKASITLAPGFNEALLGEVISVLSELC